MLDEESLAETGAGRLLGAWITADCDQVGEMLRCPAVLRE
jgi:hypothetical protein